MRLLWLLSLCAAADAHAQVPVIWTLAPEPVVSLGGAEAGPASFGRVAGVTRLSSGTLVVAENLSQYVRAFSPEGEFLAEWAGRGPGPGEFELIMSIGRCRGDSVFVYDSPHLNVTVFDPNGTVAEIIDLRSAIDVRLPPSFFACSETGVLAFVERPLPLLPLKIGPHRPNVLITLLRPSGELVHLGMFPGSERYALARTDSPRPFGKTTSVGLTADAVFVGTADAFEVLRFSVDGVPRGRIRDQVSREPIRDVHLSMLIEEKVGRFDPSQQASARSLYRQLEYPEVFPSYSKLLGGADGNIWIAQYAPPTAERQTWRVYSQQGAHIASVHVPRDFDIMEVGRDYVLGVAIEEFDVPVVRLYTLVK